MTLGLLVLGLDAPVSAPAAVVDEGKSQGGWLVKVS